MSDCDINQLMSDAAPFTGMSADQILAAQAELLCRVYTNGSGISGFTPGSVVFIGADGRAAQDNSNLYYDDSTNGLLLGDRSLLLGLAPKLGVFNLATGLAGTVISTLENLSTSSGTQSITSHYILTASSGTATPSNMTGLLTQTISGGGNAATAIGCNFSVSVTAGTTSTGSGCAGTVGCTGGAITTAQGIQALVQITSPGAATEARGCLFQVAGTGAITTVYGSRTSVTHSGTSTDHFAGHFATSTSGTVTNRYGIFINCRHAADRGLTIQQAGTPTGDPLRITTSAAAVLLKIDSGGQIWLNNAAVAETPVATHTLKIKDSGGTEYRVLCVV